MYDEKETPRARRPKPKPQNPLGERNYDSEFAKAIGRDHYDKVRGIVENTQHTKAAQVWSKFEEKVKIKPPDKRVGRAYHSAGTVYLDIGEAAAGDSIHVAYQNVFHETGHLIDYLKGASYREYFAEKHKNGAFLKAIKSDFKKLVNAKKAELQAELDMRLAARDMDWLFNNEYISYTDYRRGKCPSIAKVKVANAYSALGKEWTTAYPFIDRANFSDIFNGQTSGKYSLGVGHSQKYWKDRGDFARSTEAFAEFFDAAIANQRAYEILKSNLPNAEKIFNDLLEALLGGD